MRGLDRISRRALRDAGRIEWTSRIGDLDIEAAVMTAQGDAEQGRLGELSAVLEHVGRDLGDAQACPEGGSLGDAPAAPNLLDPGIGRRNLLRGRTKGPC